MDFIEALLIWVASCMPFFIPLTIPTGSYGFYKHAARHTDGTDDIRNATNTLKGLMTAAQVQYLEAITGNIGWRAVDIRNIADGSGTPADWTDLGEYRVSITGAIFRLSGHFKVNGYGSSKIHFRVYNVTDTEVLAYINSRADGSISDYTNFYYLKNEGTTEITSGWKVIKIQYKRNYADKTTWWKNLQLEHSF